MTQATPNLDMLAAIYRHIENVSTVDLPPCGTAHQFAARCVFQAGAEIPSAKDHGPGGNWVVYNGERRDVVALATELLGLTGRQAIRLFFMSHTLDDIRRAITDATGFDPESASSVALLAEALLVA